MNKAVIYTLPKGTYSEKATKKFLDYIDGDYKIDYCNSIYDVFERVDNNGLGVVPIENSIEGSVSLTQDLLLQFKDIKILGELALDIHHNLIGYDKNKIKTVISHPQALAQCRNYIKKHGWDVKAVESTAKAVKIVAESKDETLGAIGSKESAEHYNLKILDENIEDYKNNKTRFILIGKKVKFKYHPKNYKVSIVFELKEDKPGALYHILKEFAERNINLTRIESRPSKKRLGTYIFYIDFENNKEKLEEILKSLERHTTFINLLGKYPVFD
ncbi:TPA: prephenate dehydratase [Methanocaldococcus jannaschii]|uniref:Prephenate dehydratase n=2 Tax=Methanocaldococcus jannaschii TaxID=2190 RepID=PHEA_METJA|nr:prephenate dehydratase [Methanocaldococcus jannaschii]Q58054.1 RecName: Full=Prephenate dehydratase; Short=PDT; AltName: Full=MjPDT [Methanocaldococcus jannaschii DSM 2661]AAB98631.1 chorismate mutase/prephenate dehydratase (pheA) [Methanocaldococcus jannaschii DSM 2661]HII59591.1 prephenate dehydratase [Methanocaldococcus jannaschii]